MKRVAFLFTLLLFAACSDEGQVTAPRMPAPPPQTPGLTQFQESVQRSADSRSERGLPAPEVTFDHTSDRGISLSDLQGYAGSPGESFTFVATTTIRYDNPQEAGLDEWPATVVRGEVPPEEGFIREGDYTDEVRDYVDERIPGYWSTHEYGHEPRTRTITETITVTYGQSPGEGVAYSMVDDDLVHGFTVTGPNIDWTVGDEACVVEEYTGIEVCAWKFRAGFAFDYAFGVRLPMNVSLSSDDPVDEGDTFTPTSMASGVDWDAADYSAAGIAPEDGNEFVMRTEFFLGAFVEVAELTVLDLGPNVDEDRSSSFATPFGPGSVFALPTIDIPIWTKSIPAVYVEFGVGVTPYAGSDDFRADWLASSDLLGSGSLLYSDPTVAENLAYVLAVDGPGTGNLQINNTKYVFNQFKIGLEAYFYVNIIDLFTDRYPIPITDFDLTNLIPDISVPIHAGANPTQLNSGITIRNVAPTATINVSGAEVINGADIFFADVGESVPFQGHSYDPGRDDLTLEWDFGDESGVSTSYPLPPAAATGPNDVTDDQPHTYVEACIYPVSFEATDSDDAYSQDGAFALIRSAADNFARLAGYWLRQFSRNGIVDFDGDELGCMLQILASTSTVFNDLRDASTVELAMDVLNTSRNDGSEAEKLDRELLVAWLNFANAAFDLGDLVDTDFDLVPDTPFGAALANAEAVRSDPSATMGQLQMQREIVHDITTQRTAPES